MSRQLSREVRSPPKNQGEQSFTRTKMEAEQEAEVGLKTGEERASLDTQSCQRVGVGKERKSAKWHQLQK